MKDIVIIANFCGDFSLTDNARFIYLCKGLSDGNQVEIITSDYAHYLKKHKGPLTQQWPFKVTFLHEPGYRKNISLKRFYSHYRWGKEVEAYLKNRKKPDVIYCAVPSLTAPLKASEYCQKESVRFIIDIQDLWPEAYKMVFRVPVISDLIFLPFTRRANAIYSRADAICAVSETYADRALQVNRKKAEKHVVFLGTDVDAFDQNAARHPQKKPDGEIWVGYCGTLGASYEIDVVIKALHLLKEKGIEHVRFIVLGNGERRKEFEDLAKQLDVDCLFTGGLPYDQMCGWLKECDIAVNPIVKSSAASIINKHGDFTSAGLPVVNTQESPEYRKLIETYQMGYSVPNGDPDAFSEKLEKLVRDEALRMQMGQNARRCAEEKFDRRRTYRELMETMVRQET